MDVAATQDDVFRLERGDQTTDDVRDGLPPLRQPVLLEPAQSDRVLERSVAVRQVAQLHGLHDAIDDYGGAEPGAEPEKEILAAAVAAERLHRGIVDDLDRTSQGGPIVEPDPAATEVVRLGHGT